jgi:diguanylate cyclase (GGDEF)-like protein
MNTLAAFRHILVIEDQKARRIVALEEATYSLGRESSNDIVIYENVISRHHATLLRIKKNPLGDNYFYRIVDGDLHGNKSTNGLRVNGNSCDSHSLKHGDLIIFGGRAKASYYILPDSLNLDLFNLGDTTSLDNLFPTQLVYPDNDKSTLAAELEGTVPPDQQELIRLASFPELSPNPIIEIDFTGKITYINPASALKFSNLYEEGMNHLILKDLVNDSQNTEGNLLLREVKLGEEYYEQYVHYLADSKLIRSYIFDITEHKKIEHKLKFQAHHDLLTGLPNRAWFNKQLDITLEQSKRSKQPMAVIFLDLDNFKNVNDTLGHSIGDLVLQNFSKRISSCVRAGDTVARWGGDEFILLLPQIRDVDDTIKLSQRVIEVLRDPLEVQGHRLYIKTSLGIAIYPQDGEDGETLLKNADAALYRAKEMGRNRYQFYSSTMTSKASLILKLENLLYQALENNQFSLNYQPQVELKTGKITGVEALLTWFHPELGQVAPSKLIPLAEQTDLIIPMSEWVFKTACQQNCAWQAECILSLPVAVNFSLHQFQQPNFLTMIQGALEETGLEPSLVEVQVNEAGIMKDEDFARQAFNDLRSLGVRICLNDFGSGYASLAYLSKFPFHTLKISAAFLHSLAEHPSHSAILGAIISLSKSLELRVVAEGVETLQQLELLQRLHCAEAQGFWFSPPLKTAEATELLLSNCQLALHN